MWTHSGVIFAILSLCFVNMQEMQEDIGTISAEITEDDQKLNEQISFILEHFQQPDPIGLPGVDVPDPCHVPDMSQSNTFGTIDFQDITVHGISKFRILSVSADINAMEVNTILLIDRLQARGNYILWTWGKTQGPFTVDVTGLKITGRASLGVERNGSLRAQDIIIDASFTTMNMNLMNLGLLLGMIQGVINSMSSIFFESIKPFILQETHDKVKTELNMKLSQVTKNVHFPNSISPLDMCIALARNKAQNIGLDPYEMKDYYDATDLFRFQLSHTTIIGLSSFHRVDNITVKIEGNTVVADFVLGTQKIEGRTRWQVLNGLFSPTGTASFSVEYINVRMVIGQPLDTRQKAQFRHLGLELGNIQVRCDGAGVLDYVTELLINVLPNVLRYPVMDIIDGALIEKVQKELNEVNVADMIKEKLPQLYHKLPALLDETVLKFPELDNQDDFFNF